MVQKLGRREAADGSTTANGSRLEGWLRRRSRDFGAQPSAPSFGNAESPVRRKLHVRSLHMPKRPHLAFSILIALAGVVASAQQPVTLARDLAQPRPPVLRPLVAGPNGGVSTGHPLTTAAAFEILLNGGNAFDAGVAALLVGGVVEQDLYSLGGEALVLVYPKAESKVTSIVGQGWAPRAVDVDWFVSRGKTLQGAGLDPAV